MAVTIEQKKQASILYVPIIYKLLRDNGVNENIIPFLLAQLALETAYFTDPKLKTLNNPGGISWNPNYNKRPGTSKGSERPKKEGGYYVKFDTLETAIKDYIRIINKKGKKGKPIEANDLNDFVNRLAANNYFETSIPGSVENYRKGLLSINKRLSTWNDYAAISKKKTTLTANIGIFAVLLALGYFTKKFFG